MMKNMPCGNGYRKDCQKKICLLRHIDDMDEDNQENVTPATKRYNMRNSCFKRTAPVTQKKAKHRKNVETAHKDHLGDQDSTLLQPINENKETEDSSSETQLTWEYEVEIQTSPVIIETENDVSVEQEFSNYEGKWKDGALDLTPTSIMTQTPLTPHTPRTPRSLTSAQ